MLTCKKNRAGNSNSVEIQLADERERIFHNILPSHLRQHSPGTFTGCLHVTTGHVVSVHLTSPFCNDTKLTLISLLTNVVC